jgi:hypothetical protein
MVTTILTGIVPHASSITQQECGSSFARLIISCINKNTKKGGSSFFKFRLLVKSTRLNAANTTTPWNYNFANAYRRLNNLKICMTCNTK